VKVLRTILDVRAELDRVPERATIGLVPTMGAFHGGHLALLQTARDECDVVVVSLFVNPAQFGEAADLEAYPRDEKSDTATAERAGVDVLFAPSVEELYPSGFETWVDLDELASRLEGKYRPRHFRGVATVCLKLFNIVRPQRAFFGEKDAQQAAVVKRLVLDLNLDVEVRTVPTVRDADGLALSSRNALLSADERRRALALPRALEVGAAAHRDGEDPVAAAREALDGLEPDYVEAAELDGRLYLLAAARVGSTRLIDNVLLEGSPE
jgi:pantoate--beta-alanine ligase